MKTILRLYIQEDGKEVCERDPAKIANMLKEPAQDYDLDYSNARGHVFMGTSSELIGETVQVGDEEFEIPEH